MKIYIIIVLLGMVWTYSQGQTEVKSINLATNYSSATRHYKARDFVKMSANFKFSSSSNRTFKAEVDESLIYDAEDNGLLGTNDLTVNKSLPVGATAGSFNVSGSGAATYNISITVAPGVQGIQPNLAVVYNSQSGNGLLGMGWNLSGISAITRVPQTIEQDGAVVGVDLTATDRFTLDGNRLNVIGTETYGADGTVYGTEMETFVEATSNSGSTDNGPAWFEVKTIDGKTIEYGHEFGSCFNKDSKNIYWKVSKITDRFGNSMEFYYNIIENEHVITEIKYTNDLNSVKFFYEKRNDNNVTYIGGVAIEQNLLLRKIKVLSGGIFVRSYNFEYANDFYSKLNEVYETGSDNKKLNSTKLVWNENDISNQFSKTFGIIDGGFSYYFSDFNGDGKTDYIKYPSEYSVGDTWEAFLNDGYSQFTSIFERTMSDKSIRNIPNHRGRIQIRDFNGDGNADFIIDYIKVDENENVKYGFEKFTYSNETFILTETVEYSDPVLSLPADYNGDGKSTNLLFILEGFDEKVYNCYRQFDSYDIDGDGAKELVLKENNRIVVLGIGLDEGAIIEPLEDDYFSRAGDFNGDGKTDVLIFNDNKWSIAYSNGKTFNDLEDISFLKKTEHPNENNDNYNYLVSDFNGDGKSDIFEFFKNSKTSYFRIFYSSGNGNFVLNSYQYANEYLPLSILQQNMYITDFNGDGQSECTFVPISSDKIALNIYPQQFNKSNMLSSIYTGIGNQIDLTYRSLTYGSTFYGKGSSADYPVTDFQGPLYTVYKTEQPNGVGGIMETEYSYAGAKIHKTGKGFLGFESIISENKTTDIITETTQTWENSSSYVVESTKTTVNKGSTNLSETTINFEREPISSTQGKKRYFTHPTTKTVVNELTDATTTITFEYSDNWLNKKTVQFSGGTTEKVETFYNYTDFSGIHLKIPTTITTTQTLDGETFTSTNELTNFNSDKLPQTITKNGFSTDYEYDSYGNITHKEITVDGTDRIVDYGYDSYGRFLTTKTVNSSHVSLYGYNGMGNLTTKTAINGNNTQYFYDGFGRLTSTELPDGNTAENKLEWDNTGGNNIEYYTHSSITGGPDSWQYYDIFGRAIKTETEGFGSQLHTTQKTYNPNGTVATETMQDKEATYIYNPDDGRIASKTFDGNTTTYSYSGRTTTITSPSGFSSKTFDGAGRLRTAEDNGGIISYEYDGCGEVNRIAYDNGKTITMGYDNNGYQDWLNDPDAGLIDYTYNPIGELTFMKDANNNETTYEYDNFGRLEEEILEEGTITYDYITNGSGIGQIEKIIGYNNIFQEYTYDNFGRVATALEDINSESKLMKTFGYDIFGNITTETYDADNNGSIELTLTHEYDKGILKKVKLASQTLWQLNTMNQYGQITDYDLGSENVTKDYDDRGQLELVQYYDYYLAYEFNETTGNLNRRKNSYGNGIVESFNYDDLNRLTNTYHNGTLVHSVNYANSGNIMRKTNAGYYAYHNTIPGAVDKVSTEAIPPDGNPGPPDPPSGNTSMNPFPTIPTDVNTVPQTITYTSFHKTNTISENNNRFNFTYGHNKARKKVVKYINLGGTFTTYYHGNYEKEETSSNTKQTFYINGGNGLAAMYIIQNGTATMYAVHTDHLGSIIALRNSSTNTIAERYSYDAWGRRRNPSNLSYTGFSTPITHRGFTGHEHLDNIQLINMNGRTYDPILGRMLSPDNNVQMPDFTQNLNRYTYALNNPLVYTDPDGEWIQFAILGLFILGKTYHDGVKAHDGELNPFKWNKPDTYVIGVSTNSDGSNASVYAGVGWGGGTVPIVSYNNNAGFGGGLGDAYGNNSSYYPFYNYNAPEQNAHNAIENTRNQYMDEWQAASYDINYEYGIGTKSVKSGRGSLNYMGRNRYDINSNYNLRNDYHNNSNKTTIENIVYSAPFFYPTTYIAIPVLNIFESFGTFFKPSAIEMQIMTNPNLSDKERYELMMMRFHLEQIKNGHKP